MPRTKRAPTISKPNEPKINNSETLLLNAARRDMKRLDCVEKHLCNYIEEQCSLLELMIPVAHISRTIGDYKNYNSTLMKTCYESLDNVSTASKSTMKTASRKKRSSSCGTDDGGSMSSTAAKAKRSSRSKARAPLANSTTRVSRSLSRNRALPITSTAIKGAKYTTPMNKQPANSYGLITPKMKPNTPQIILRRPKHGEVAVSMDGSPLMVNPVAVDNAANINIPLGDGKLLSLQPGRNLRVSQVPQLDYETAKQLKSLGEHIQKICQMNMASK